jgi:8-oxo-dGTP diphosphatase/2-hydroxy-dATP diphosphatase
MKNSTLLFLIRKSIDGGVDICLAMKKRGFGAGRFNGVGGKVEDNETIEDAVKREAEEEVGVSVGEVVKCAELTFVFPHEPSFDQVVHVYTTEEFEGEPSETEEMSPSWLSTSYIPYDDMWPDDIFWLPLVLEGKKVKGQFVFGEGEVIKEKEVEVVEAL